MRVYSSARNHRKSSGLNDSLKHNLEVLADLLKHQNSPTLSLTPSLQSLDD
jgi:hypothetical protein